MKILKIAGPCPKGGSRLYLDEEGNVHACRLQYYLNTAKHLLCDRLQFTDTIITLKKQAS